MKASVHPVVFFDIGCKDLEKNTLFYQNLFGWSATGIPFANLINTGVTDGIQGQITALGHEPHNYVLVYIVVDDIDAHFEQVVSEGGQKVIGPITLPGGKQFAWFKDPEGNMLGLVTNP